MPTVKATFSDDRGTKLEHYGVKGMKWHQHMKNYYDFATDVAEGKREWSGDSGTKRVIGTVSTAVRSAKRHGLIKKGSAKERAERGKIRIRAILSKRRK